MTKSERASIVTKILEEYYPKTPIPLDHNDNFTLLVAVLLATLKAILATFGNS